VFYRDFKRGKQLALWWSPTSGRGSGVDDTCVSIGPSSTGGIISGNIPIPVADIGGGGVWVNVERTAAEHGSDVAARFLKVALIDTIFPAGGPVILSSIRGSDVSLDVCPKCETITLQRTN
jgi:hypothetical protein